MDDETNTEVVEETTTEEDTSTSEEKTVPEARFQEVYKKGKETEKELDALKQQQTKETPTGDNKEAQAEEYLSKLVDKRLTAREESETKQEKKETDEFNNSVDDTLAVHTDVKKDDFLKFIEEKGEKYGIKSAGEAMEIYRDMNNLAKETEEETKENLSTRPTLPSNEGTPSTETKHDDSDKSIEQIAEEAAAEIK